MIVSCPECRTLFRHENGARRWARCGACHAEIRLPSARTYRVRPVLEASARPIAVAPAPIFAAAAAGAGPATGGPAAWIRPRPRARAEVLDARTSRPAARAWERLDGEVPARPSLVDRRLDEIVRTAETATAIEDSTVRNVLLGVGIGAVAGVAFAPGMFDASWVSWAVGGAMGGVAAALWSRAWGLRRA